MLSIVYLFDLSRIASSGGYRGFMPKMCFCLLLILNESIGIYSISNCLLNENIDAMHDLFHFFLSVLGFIRIEISFK